jgi:hypothetical protein
MDTVSEAIRDKDTYNPVFRSVKNLGVINEIQISESGEDSLQIALITTDRASISPSKLKAYKLLDKNLPVKFVDAFGVNDEFKKLFDEIEKETTLSKKEISDLIRHNTVGENTHKSKVSFTFKIPISCFTCEVKS